MVELMAVLPEEQSRFLLLRLWEQPGLQDAVVKVLATKPKLEDEHKFIAGLGSFNPEIVRVSAEALSTFNELRWRSELIAAIKALRRLTKEDKAARLAVVALLEKRTKRQLGMDTKRWLTWVADDRPDLVPLLAVNDGFDAAAWKKREGDIAWDKGSPERGRLVFTKASCAACHDGGRALGPSLLGISKRFGHDDLLTSILQPSKDVSPRYRPIRITTNDEKGFIGMLIYEATDGVILRTNADSSVRIAGENLASKRPVEASLMPAGLLDKLTDMEVADLFAYLVTLEEPKR
ncbi:MAG: hypothetical protein C0467_26830 [Planctomycetaceae bacterium]|nr:hypothetical protein [Planctomycetaceae bacterium]